MKLAEKILAGIMAFIMILSLGIWLGSTPLKETAQEKAMNRCLELGGIPTFWRETYHECQFVK